MLAYTLHPLFPCMFFSGKMLHSTIYIGTKPSFRTIKYILTEKTVFLLVAMITIKSIMCYIIDMIVIHVKFNVYILWQCGFLTQFNVRQGESEVR